MPDSWVRNLRAERAASPARAVASLLSRRWGLLVPAVLGAAVIATVLRARFRPPVAPEPIATPPAAQPGPAPVQAGDASYVGVVLSERAVDVVARVDGVLVQVPVKLGQRVPADAIVARIDVPKLTEQLSMARAAADAAAIDLARAGAELVEAKRVVGQKQRLQAAGVGSADAVEEARFQQRMAELRLKEARAKLSQQRAHVDELKHDTEAATVRAPFAGTIALRYVDAGTSVQSLTRLVRIVAEGKPFVRFAIPSADAKRVRPGTDVVATCPASVGTARASVESVSPEIDAAANLLVVEATVDEASGGWRSGELVRVALTDGG